MQETREMPVGSGGKTTLNYLGQLCGKLMRTVLFICLTFCILYPVLFMLSMALRQSSDLFDPSVIWIPKKLVLDNIFKTMEAIQYGKTLSNSAFLAIGCSVIQVVVCSTVGYGLARFRFRGRGVLMAVLLFTIVVPAQLISLPTYFTFQNLDFFGLFQAITGHPSGISLLNTPVLFFVLAIFGQGIRSGLFVLIYRQLYISLPLELEDAAMVDGAGFARTYCRIMAPNSGTVTVVVFLFSLVWYWNDYYLTYIYAGDFQTLSTVIANLRAAFESTQDYTYDVYEMVVMEQASCLLFILPVLILYIFTQRFFTEGIERTGIVG